MLEKPDLPDDLLMKRAQEEYGLRAADLTFLPLGVDVNTAVYRLEAEDGAAYFLKLRKAGFDSLAVELPRMLRAQGVPGIIDPLETQSGQGWGNLGEYKLVLYPFVEGQDGYQAALSDRQWVDFGISLKGIHQSQVPPELSRRLKKEDYAQDGRDKVRQFQVQVEKEAFEEPVAARLAVFMRQRRQEISHILQRADRLGEQLKAHSPECVLCHGDLHPGNLLVCSDNGLYIVDWDDPMLAPKERDLMFIDGGVGDIPVWSPSAVLFYQGYGEAAVDRTALAYYRYERIVQDMAAFCESLLLTGEGGEDRQQGYVYFTSSFMPGHDYDRARQTELTG